jgi:hypothetical protein
MENAFFWDVTRCDSLRTDVSIVRVTRIGELGTTLAVPGNGISMRTSDASYN